MSDKINLGSFSFDSSQIEKKLQEVESQLTQLTDSLSKVQIEINKTSKEFLDQKKVLDQLAKTAGVSSTAYKEVQKSLATMAGTLAENRNKVRELNVSIEQHTSTQQQLRGILTDIVHANEITTNSYSAQGRSVQQLANDHRVLTQLLERERSLNGEVADSVSRLENDLNQVNQAQQRLATQTRDTSTQVDRQSNTMDSGVESANSFGDALGGVRDGMSQLASGNVVGGLTALRTAFSQLTASAMAFIMSPIGIAITALSGIVVATKEMYGYNQEMQKASNIVAQFTGLAGESLENMTVKLQTFANQTGAELSEVTRTANTLAKSFGISYEEAFTKMQDGYIRVGASAEDFFDNTDEYAVHFQKAGYSADEFFAIMEAGAQGGAFKDKLPDAIKEVGLKLADLSKGGKEALEDAFGKSFTDKLVKGVESGSISTKKALEMLSAETKKAGVNQSQLQKISADVFGAMGEDVGGFTKILEMVETGLQKSEEGLTETQKASKKAMEAQEEFNQVFADLFNLTDNGFGKMMADIKTAFFGILSKAVKVVIDVANGFVDVYNNSMLVRAVIGGIGSVFNAQMTLVQSSLKLLWNGLKTTGNLIKSVLTMDVNGIQNAISQGWTNSMNIVKDGAKSIKDDITSTINSVKGAKLNKIELGSSKVEGGGSKIDGPTIKASKDDDDDKKKDKKSKTLGKDNKALKEAEKAAKAAEDALAKELENQIKLQNEKANLMAQYAQQELENKIANSKSLLDEEQRLSQELINEELKRIEEIAKIKGDQLNFEKDQKLKAVEDETSAEERRLQNLVDSGKLANEKRLELMDIFNENQKIKQDLINQEYQQKELEQVVILHDAKKEVQKQLDEQDAEDAQLARELDLETKMLEIQENAWFDYETEKAVNDQIYENKKADLDKQYADGKISHANYLQAKANLEKQYEQDTKALTLRNNLEKAQNMSDMFSNAKSLFAENTAAHKAMAIGEATANTYMGATRALADYPAPISYVMAGTTIATGLLSVAKIMGIGKATGGPNTDNNGGYTGDGSTYGRASYIPIHNGEVVFSRADVRSLGGVANVESMRPTSNQFNQQNMMGDNSQLFEIVAQAVERGSERGSQRGTINGQVKASINRSIQRKSSY